MEPCPSPLTLQRIVSARWSPYVAETLKNWSRETLEAPGACTSRRAGDCDACRALQKIVSLRWSEALSERIQLAARDALDRPPLRRPAASESMAAMAY
jgi:hypothetical protein